MKCPACSKLLKELKVDDIVVDVCENGCGGVWFDAFELKRVDDLHDITGAKLVMAVAEKAVITPLPDNDAKRECPRCAGVKLKKHFFSPRRRVRVDQCPNCGGYWLDHGELEAIRTENHMSKSAEKPKELSMEMIRFLYRMRTEGRDTGSTTK